MHSRDSASEDKTWDVAVIGGGAAGMMAAGRAAELGARVILLEKNASLGKKLLITGGGRCNVTNAETDVRVFLSKYKDGGKFLASPFAAWSTKETLEFFNSRGMQTKVEAQQRVFPVSNSAQSVWDVLFGYLSNSNVTVRSDATVTSIESSGASITHISLRGGETIHAHAFILATGGISHPETGSTGDGYRWLRGLGHSVREPSVSLVPVSLLRPVTEAAGVSIADAKISLFQNDVRQSQSRGKVLFTHVGLSGPGILNMSNDIGELLKYGEVVIELDLFPETGYEKIDAALQKLFKDENNKLIKNALRALVPPALVSAILASASVDPETQCNSVTRSSRIALMKSLKHFRLEASGLLGADKAVITAGGVALTEVDFKSMRSTRYENLFLVGDILDIDRPSGGYSLQLCWTTGQVAGAAAAYAAREARERQDHIPAIPKSFPMP